MMTPTTLQLDDRVTRAFAGHSCAVIRVRSDSTLEVAERVDQALRDTLAGPEGVAIVELAERVADRWADVFAAMGAKPKYKSSLGSLLEHLGEVGPDRFCRGLPPVVQLYNLLSLYCGTPMAGYRTEAVAWPLVLTLPGKGQAFVPLGRPQEMQRTKTGEVAYVDGERVVCRYWNLGDCHDTRLRGDEKDIVFTFDVIEDVGHEPAHVVRRAKDVLSEAFDSPSVVSGVIDARHSPASVTV